MAIKQVVFKLDNESYGLEIIKVFGIERFQEVLKIPNTPSYIEGVINLRGEVLPIYSLRKKFNLEKKPIDDETKIIITKANDMQIGFIVDAVSEIIDIPDDAIEETPQIIRGVDRKYIKNIATIDERMIILLDIDLVLSEEELEVAKEVAASAE